MGFFRVLWKNDNWKAYMYLLKISIPGQIVSDDSIQILVNLTVTQFITLEAESHLEGLYWVIRAKWD